MTSPTQPVRAERIEAIRDAAEVRARLGQGAQYRRLPDGSHEIIFRGRIFIQPTLDVAIAEAKGNTR